MSEATVTVAEAILEIRRVFPASAKRLFDCFTDPRHLARWWGPEGTTCPTAEVDLRPGGRYRLEILSENGNLSTVTGEYLEIDPPNRLVFSWRWEDSPDEITRVTLDITGNDRRAELQLRHERFPNDERAELHGTGWASSLNCLADLLAD